MKERKPGTGRLRPLPPSFFHRPTDRVARELLGRFLVRELDGERLVVRIVETEAYLGAPDRASHAWGGRRTQRNESLYRPPGTAYVYFIYGMHFCLNVVANRAASGGAVLLRAGEEVAGGETMRRLRRRPAPLRPGELAGGPGKLAQALAVDRRFDGEAFGSGSLTLAAGEPVTAASVLAGPRVGISYAEEAVDWPLRFAVAGSAEVSRPRKGLAPWSGERFEGAPIGEERGS